MKKTFAILIIATVLYGCELIDISKKETRKHINLTQDSPVGTVCLFMTELDSNNIKGATVLLADSNGKIMLAEDRYELYYEMARLNRLMRFKPITDIITDTLSATSFQVSMYVDYIKHYSFVTEKIENEWYITNYNTSN
jgi:hypothetical protein